MFNRDKNPELYDWIVNYMEENGTTWEEMVNEYEDMFGLEEE